MFLLAVGLSPAVAREDGRTTPAVGLRNHTTIVHALTGGRVVIRPGETIENGTVLIRNGVIEAAGEDIEVPEGSRTWEMEGKTVYPAFLDLDSDLGMPGADALGQAAHWNPQVRPELDAAALFRPDHSRAGQLRSQGFGLVLAAPRHGMFRGRSALLLTGEGDAADLIVARNVTLNHSFQRSRDLGGGYPTSLMGAVALARQTWSDAQWYEQAWQAYRDGESAGQRPEMNAALESLRRAAMGEQTVLMDARDDLDFLRALKLAGDFSLKVWMRGSGHEYRAIDQIRSAEVPVIVPVAFPEAPRVATVEDGRRQSLEVLLHWDVAPENPARLHQGGVNMTLTASGSSNPTRFLERVTEAVSRGLPEEAALAALTTTPAEWLGVEGRFGSLKPGRAANIIVADGPLFHKGTKIEAVWVDGRRYPVTIPRDDRIFGEWTVRVDWREEPFPLKIRLDKNRLRGAVEIDEEEISAESLRFEGGRLSFQLPGKIAERPGAIRWSAQVAGEEMDGMGELPDGQYFQWRADRREHQPPQPPAASSKPALPALFEGRYPAMAFGLPLSSSHSAIPHWIRNATLWTQGPQGRIERGDLLIIDGKIEQVGRSLTPPSGSVVIDAEGKHITPGLIDAHLHSGIIGGVNETGAAVTAEVRIQDVLQSANSSMIHLLAGGLTTAHVMHGSANPIGGQNATIKIRWGALPEDLLFENAPGTIKFALGENVIRNTGRYPNTRMGVEQIIRDEFEAALAYGRQSNNPNRAGLPARRDYRLEAILEVLRGERLVHAHCYRQDEILMLIRLAEEYGVQIASFHHTVEGYKVADALAQHGAGAAIWSDWWAFKVESYDGTTYNARLLLDQGVRAAIHSDNTQIASRMNWEAAKTLRTGVSEEQALSLVTLNPAHLLGIEDRVGSLEPGKDADFVIWNGPPLSAFSIVEQTWIEGQKYFDRAAYFEEQRRMERQRAQLIQRVLGNNDAKEKKEEEVPPEAPDPANLVHTYSNEANCRCVEVYHVK